MNRLRCFASVLILGAAVAAAQSFNDLKMRWRAGDYLNVLKPLIDLHYALPPQSPAAQEVDYMLTNTLCAVEKYRDRGCEYSKNIARSYGAYVFFEGRRFNTADLARRCCPQEQALGYADSRGASTVPSLRASDQILNDVVQALPITTTLNTQRTALTLPGDWITGFSLVDVTRANDSFFHWLVRLEVEYIYNIGHGSAAVTGVARGGPLVSGYSYWRAKQEQPHGPQFRKGVEYLQIAIQVQQPEAVSSVVSLSLQEALPPYRTIITQEFPFTRVFRVP